MQPKQLRSSWNRLEGVPLEASPFPDKSPPRRRTARQLAYERCRRRVEAYFADHPDQCGRIYVKAWQSRTAHQAGVEAAKMKVTVFRNQERYGLAVRQQTIWFTVWPEDRTGLEPIVRIGRPRQPVRARLERTREDLLRRLDAMVEGAEVQLFIEENRLEARWARLRVLSDADRPDKLEAEGGGVGDGPEGLLDDGDGDGAEEPDGDD